MVTGAVALAEYAHVVADEVPGQRRAAHRPLPQGQARRLRAPADRHLAGAGGRRPGPAVPVAHVGRLGRAAGGEPGDRPGAARQVRAAPRSSWRSRSASSAARRTASSARSTRSSTPRPRTPWRPPRPLGLGEQGRYMLAATFGNVHGVYKPGNVKLRPERAEGDPGRRRRQVRQGQAVRPGLPRRLRLALEEIREALYYGVVKMNVDTDTQYAFTRPIADHMFTQLRRRAQGRRRGRQQEGLRPARLGQGRRGRDGGPRRRGLRGPEVRGTKIS